MKRKFEILFAIAAIVVLASTSMANYSQQQKITSTPRGVGAQFGNAIAISGNTMVVGAQFDGTTASQAGAAFVFVTDGTTWSQQARLLASDGAVADKFGTSVAISGDTVVVGAFNANAPLSNSGAAYVFVRSGTTWTQQQKLTASDATSDDQFGFSAAITGDVIAIGANHADFPGNSEAGAVYRYNRTGTTWTQVQRLNPVAQVILGDHFGDSMAISGNRLVIGASGDDTPQTSAGAVYVFDDSGSAYGLEQKLTIPDGTNGDQFGFSVDIDGSTIVGGAKEDTTVVGQVGIGAAYVFEFSGSSWSLEQKLLASDGLAFDRFGYSTAVRGNTVAVGAREDDTAAGPDTGSQYIFTRTGTVWTQTQKLLPTDSFNGDRFGVSSTFSGTGDLVIGAAEKALTNPNGQGAVYTFHQPQGLTPFDYDGDLRSDISVYRPSTGTWYLQLSGSGFSAQQWGISSDRITPADFDGDGKTDIAVYRPSSGTWYVLNSSDMTVSATPFGLAEDLPVPADYDGDGRADISVFRSSSGTWYRLNSSDGSFFAAQFGISTDKPVAGDYDGDGRADLAVYREGSGTWYMLGSTQGFSAVQFGISTDKPAPADYDGDAKTDQCVYRDGTWYVLGSTRGFTATQFGIATDIPAPSDLDGDGKADITVFRPSQGTWYQLNSSNGFVISTPFGLSEDKPTQSAFAY
jgi:hypothetical protein